MTVRTRLLITIVGISLLMGGPAIYSASRLADLRNIAQTQSKIAQAFHELGALQTALSELDRYARSYIVIREPQQRAGIDRAISAARNHLRVLESSDFPKEARIAASKFDAIEAATRHIINLVESGREAEATPYFERVRPLLEEADAAIDTIAAAIDSRSQAQINAAGGIASAARTTTLLGLAIALGAVLLIGSWTTHSLTAPIRRLRRAMATVAAGEFVEPENLPYQRGDEIGDLARSFSWMTQQLAKLDRMKAEFVSIATHELKNPITVISGYSELIEEGVYGPVPPEQRVALQAIREQTQVVSRLINQLLDVSRLEAGGLRLVVHDVVVEDLVRTLERSFGILAGKRNIGLDFEVTDSIPARIQADSDRLRDQVLGNLLSNALKFTPEGGTIRVRLWGDEDGLQIEVADSGVGIPADQLPHVFDKFYQVGQQARSKGAGLGLAIAREVVEAHDGRIWVESTEDVGTTFRISLPVEHEGGPDAFETDLIAHAPTRAQ